MALVMTCKAVADRKGDAGAGRVGMAARAEALDRADPRHHQN